VAGLVPAIHVEARIAGLRKQRRRLQVRSMAFLKPTSHVTAWMAGTSPAMTRTTSIKGIYNANARSRE